MICFSCKLPYCAVKGTHSRSKRRLDFLLPAKDASKEHLVPPQGNLEAKLDLRKKSHSFTPAQHREDQVIGRTCEKLFHVYVGDKM